jgi:hypothetical protein
MKFQIRSACAQCSRATSQRERCMRACVSASSLDQVSSDDTPENREHDDGIWHASAELDLRDQPYSMPHLV